MKSDHHILHGLNKTDIKGFLSTYKSCGRTATLLQISSALVPSPVRSLLFVNFELHNFDHEDFLNHCRS